MRLRCITVVLLLAPILAVAQEDLVSKKRQLESDITVSERTELLDSIINEYFTKNRNADSAFVYIDKLEKIAQQEKDSLLFAKVYQGKAHAHYLNSEFYKTEELSFKAISIYESRDQMVDAAKVKYVLGNAYQVLYRNKDAIEMFRAAEPYLINGDLVMLYVGLAAGYSQIYDLETALEYYNKAFGIANEMGTRKYHYDIYNGIATVHERNEDNESALESVKNALAEAEASRDALAQVVCHHNIGYLLRTMERYEESKEHFEAGIALLPEISPKFLKASTRMYYAEVLYYMDKLEAAEFQLDLAEKLFHEVYESDEKHSIIQQLRGRIEDEKGNYDKSIEILKEAVVLGTDDGKPSRNAQTSYKFLSEVYEKQGRSAEALEAFRNYESIKDSLQQERNSQKIEALKVKFEVAEYQQELKTANQELVLLEEKKKTSNYRNVLLGVVSLGLVLFIYRQRKLNRAKRRALETEKELIALKEKQLNMEVQHKNTEITDFALQINERNKLLDTFNDRIRNIKKHASTEIKTQLAELQLYIGDLMEVNKAKVSLNTKVEETQESFRYKLTQSSAKLSPKEMQVATYLRLNLPSKQIATQMGIAEQSVNNYRRSIRKKFDLSKDVNLVDFLRNV